MRRAGGARGATREVDRLIKEGFTHVVDADLASYFDTIPHDRLVTRIEEHVIDGKVLDLIRGWLKADILKGLDRWTPVQGSPRPCGAWHCHDVPLSALCWPTSISTRWTS